MKKFRVYVVDDKRLIRESLIKTVRWENSGFEVVGSAGDGITAEEKIRQLRPDLVVTDIRMPGRDGLTLTENILEILPKTQVIIITGHEEFEYAQRSLRAGALDIILKPIRNEDLERVLQKAAERLGEPVERPAGNSGEFRNYGPLVRSILAYIDDNISGDIRLTTMAEIYRVTPSHLSRTFKKETGNTFLQYVTEKRIEKSREMLADPTNRISDISQICGFPNPVVFARTFKRTVGMTPSCYRRSARA